MIGLWRGARARDTKSEPGASERASDPADTRLGWPSRFPYQAIVDGLRASILDGRLEAGARLPSENELAHCYRTSRPTVRRAIALLKAEGLVTAEQGRGAFVRPKPHVRVLISEDGFRRRRAGRSRSNDQVEEPGQQLEQRLLKVGWVTAPREVALRLDLDEDPRVVVRRRLFVINGEAVARCDSYYPADVADGTPLADPERIAGGTHGLIDDPAGPIARRLKRFVDDLVSRMPTPDEVDWLELAPGVPVVRTLRTVYDSGGRAVEVQDTVAAADKHQFRYEVWMR